MNQEELRKALAGLPLGPLRYFDQIGSTNDEAARWADAGAPDLSLVVANEQTAGRGRLARRWFSPPGAALAFSLVLRPSQSSGQIGALPYDPGRLSALGALAVSSALQEKYSLSGQIKWPNDVLLEQRKVSGVLAEAHWQGDRLAAVILGIGINVTQAAVPPEDQLAFPATSVEAVLEQRVERLDLLRTVLAQVLEWRPRLGSPEFLAAWEARLAFRGEWVWIVTGSSGDAKLAGSEAQVLGLEPDGSLRLRDRTGKNFTLHIGEVRLRPVDSSPG